MGYLTSDAFVSRLLPPSLPFRLALRPRWRGRLHDGTAAVGRAAVALVELLLLGVASLLVLVIVVELLPFLDRADRLDPDAPVLDHRFAVGVARVIDVDRLVAVDGAVDDGAR